jgi:SAM-dependent methyltransferase
VALVTKLISVAPRHVRRAARSCRIRQDGRFRSVSYRKASVPSNATDLTVTFPPTDTRPDQDSEWCMAEIDGEQRRVRFHDYDEIYEVPGLYERIFYEHLGCTSPDVVCGLLADELQAGGYNGPFKALDVGAGNGMVAECLRKLGADPIVGIDILDEAKMAAERDRPGLYAEYFVCDLTELSERTSERLHDYEFGIMTTVAALGYDDIPPKAFAEAFNHLCNGGWVAFNIKADFLDGGDKTGFRGLIADMLEHGVLEERARRSYQHRRSMTGEPLTYVAMVGVKRADVPEAWTD